MPATVFVVAALAVLAVVVVAGWAAYRLHRLRRALDAERAARRLTSGMHARDMQAFHDRIRGLLQDQAATLQDRAVITAAEQILDTELAAHHRTEGGQP